MDLSHEYLIWNDRSVPRMYTAEQIVCPEGVEDFEFRLGLPLQDKWKDNGFCLIANGDPKKPIVPDALSNTDRLLIVSERLMTALKKAGSDQVEFLPLKLTDMKKRPLGITYFAINFLEPPDCLDLKASEAQLSSTSSRRVTALKRLEFKRDPKRAFFVPAQYYPAKLLKWPIAEALSKEGFSGLEWRPLFVHPKLYKAPSRPEIQTKVDAFNKQLSRAKPEPLNAFPQETPRKRSPLPKEALRRWLTLADPKKKKWRVDGQTFIPSLGDEAWLEAYEDSPDDWPSFDPKRYYCLGTDLNGNAYLIDLEDGLSVVYMTHEAGYGEHENFAPVATDLDNFLKLMTAMNEP